MDNIIVDVNFDIENYMYWSLRKYLSEKSKFITNPSKQIFPKTPMQLADFPTIIIKETNNADEVRYRTLDRTQQVNQITDTIEIYTQDITLNGVRYASKTVMNELKYLVFDFFEYYGATRISCSPAEYSNRQVDRLVIVERYLQNNWNRKID